MIILGVLLIAWVGALTRTVFGFGEALVSMPLLALIGFDLQTSTALIGAVGLLVALPATIREWHHIDFKAVRRLVTGSLIGVPLGILVIKKVPAAIVLHGLGIFLIAYGIYNLWHSLSGRVGRPHLQAQGYDYLTGIISGALGSAYNSHGVPVAVYGTLKKWSAQQLRAILQAHFLCVGILVVASHLAAGFWSIDALEVLAMVIPGLLVVVPFGNWLVARIAPERAIKLVYGALIIFGILLMTK
ncbi:sulfite exporter TauE/SafE family protein [Pediococcus pentosaceus]|uniref:sulfite exporter TauE/SafE family protein n=1 Tax=Pediococcus pentosaceus TaxID=1255 RepID=UPI0018A13F8B|nr:sulfite exporter TauE/SafE family protein [Pediococcus pentosaceus]MBF7128961.1 sulfite exporter TauE/SafE family protein [Pediococcus pentosaceus]MBF7131911.1 sulfite exporter TauE/SafE family protein [Pediococcus pentosaceus]